MADHCGRKLRHRDYLIENAMMENTKFIDCAIPANTINEKDPWMNELLGNTDWSVREKLSLSSMQLTQLPEEFAVYINNLAELDLSNNKLTTVPRSLKFIERLERLLLDRNSIKTLPLAIVELSHLRVLQLSNNSIVTLPSNFGDIVSLETLILHCNNLAELPASCVKLNRLKNLDLSQNNFLQLPLWFGDLESLESLNLRANKLSDLPASCGELKRLENLDLSRNRFDRFPSSLTRGMYSLEILDVSHNKYMNIAVAPASAKLRELYIREIGSNLKFPLWLFTGCAPALEVLVLEGTRFKTFDIPDNCPILAMKSLSLQRCGFYDPFIRELTKRTDRLESLGIGNGGTNFNGNAFTAMPIENLKNPELLTEIDLRGTGLFGICGAIEKCVNLTRLDIGNNNINWLCEEICSLEKLKVMLIDENYLHALPRNIGDMRALKELKVNDNALDCLPETIKHLKNLTYLDLYNNEFRRMPMELKYMDTLLGLDIDQNNFTIDETDNISEQQFRRKLGRKVVTIGGSFVAIGDTSYGNLRKAIRNHYRTRSYIRRDGPRYASDRSEEADTGSEISSIEFHHLETNVKENINVFEEEDWENSADEFEPNRPPTQSYFEAYPPLTATFCPADLHVQSVRHRAAHDEGKYEIMDQFETEGRFDDA